VAVVDAVGAGDSFDAGFIFGYLNKWALEKTLQLAIACGSISTLKPGGTDGQATLTNAEVFIEEYLT
jgi:sugar/nucleoside kinase (ribokinase family)